MGTNIKGIIAGLPKKATEYITQNSYFVKNKHIGCKKSDGVLNVNAKMSKIEVASGISVIMFDYLLNNGRSKTKVQKVIDNHVFISLETPEGKEIKWSTKEIKNYFNDLT